MDRQDWLLWLNYFLLAVAGVILYFAVAFYGPPWYACGPLIGALLAQTGCDRSPPMWAWPVFFLIDCLGLLVIFTALLVAFLPFWLIYQCICPVLPSESTPKNDQRLDF